jgi:NAD(P)H dehydrogenase (quinone)
MSKAKVAIIYYSLYGHVKVLADSIKKGVEEAGLTCDIYQVAETLPDEVLTMMHAPPKADDPIITPDKMTEYDGFLFGISGWFGSVSAQMRSFMDSTGQLWMSGALVGKAAGIFQSTAQQGGGQESIGLTFVPFAVHHGMVFVPMGYTHPKLFTNAVVHGGSAWGSGTLSNSDGSRMPSELELDVAASHGKHFAAITSKLAATEF